MFQRRPLATLIALQSLGLAVSWTCSLLALQDAVDHPAVDIGKPIIASAVSERQSLVIPAHQMQDRRMEVMHIDPVLVDPKSMLVGRAVDDPRLDACSG